MKKLLRMVLALCLVLTLLPATSVSAAGVTKTINCGDFTLEISDVYAMDSISASGGDGFTTIYFVVVTDAAQIACTRYTSDYPNDYLIWPFNSIVFTEGPRYPTLERACEYDDAENLRFNQGTTISPEVNNEYYFVGGMDGVWHGVRIFVVDAATAALFGSVTPVTPETAEPAASTTDSELSASAPAAFATPGTAAPEASGSSVAAFVAPETSGSESSASAPATFAMPGASASEVSEPAVAAFVAPAPSSPESPVQAAEEAAPQTADILMPSAAAAQANDSGRPIIAFGIGVALVIGGIAAAIAVWRRKHPARPAAPK